MNVFVVTPAFCKSKLLYECLNHLHENKLIPRGSKHIIIDNHYPIKKRDNREEIRLLALSYGCIYQDSGRDLGLHAGINKAVLDQRILPGDLLIGCDPDDRPTPGTFQAMIDVMSDPSGYSRIAMIASMFDVMRQKQSAGLVMRSEPIAGHEVLFHPGIEMFRVAAFNMSFIHDIGGFGQIRPYYGCLEIYLHAHYKKKKLSLAYLKDTDIARADVSSPYLVDREYEQWKKDALMRDDRSFEEWLGEKYPQVL